MKLGSITILTVVWSLGIYAEAKRIPYIEPCPRELKEPEWSECLKQSLNKAYPYFMKGDPEWRIPTMDPLHEDKLVLDQTSSLAGITLDLTNATISGLKTGKFNKCSLDLDNGVLKCDLSATEINITSDYFLSGRILALYANGSGDDFISMKNLIGTLSINFYKTIKPGSDGVLHEFFTVTNLKFNFNAKSVTMQFNNLFNGNKVLEDYANQFLSRNWRELYNFFGPGVNRAIRNVLDKALTDANEFLALDELYPFPEGTVLIPSKSFNIHYRN